MSPGYYPMILLQEHANLNAIRPYNVYGQCVHANGKLLIIPTNSNPEGANSQLPSANGLLKKFI
jgi:hypothetical protein